MRSYVVKKENSRETIRSSRHIKFAAKRGETRIRFAENTDNEAMDTSDDNTENEYDTAVDETAERESLGPENGPAQRTRQRLARGAGGLAVGAGGAC